MTKMSRIYEETIKQIRETADIHEIVSEYVQLKKRGRNFFGLCPFQHFHDEKTPLFSISQQRQIYKCFGCGAGGDVIDFIKEVELLEFSDATQYLADRYKIELDLNNNKIKRRVKMGRAIDVDKSIVDLNRRLKLVEDALEELLDDVDLHEDTSDVVAEGIEVVEDEVFTPPVGKRKKTETKKPEVVESLL